MPECSNNLRFSFKEIKNLSSRELQLTLFFQKDKKKIIEQGPPLIQSDKLSSSFGEFFKRFQSDKLSFSFGYL